MTTLTGLGRSPFNRFVHVGLLSGLLLAAPGRAHAQTDSAAARALFAEARSLMEQERYEDACPKFEESLRLDHGMGTQFNLAHCWEKVGRTASAWAMFLDVAAAARAGNQPQRETAARERAKALEAKLTRLRIEVPDPVAKMKIERDGQDVGRAAWGTSMPVDPGKHVITVSAPGKKDWSDDVDVPASSRTFSVTVPALAEAPAPTPVTEVGSGSESPAPVEASVDARSDGGGGGSSGQKVAALVVGGVGLAAVATGTIFAIQSRSDNSEALKLCRTDQPDGTQNCADSGEEARHKQLVEDAERGRLIGFIGIGVGGAALVTSLILYITADSGSSSSASSWQVAPILGADIGGATLSGHF